MQHAKRCWRFGNGLLLKPVRFRSDNITDSLEEGHFLQLWHLFKCLSRFWADQAACTEEYHCPADCLGTSALSAMWVSNELPTAHRQTSHHSFPVFVGNSASCWKKTGHCLCMKTSDSTFLPKTCSVQMRSDCSDSHVEGTGICNCNASGDNHELI